ncbi:uncharacterized protein WCC33_000060 [Rhinophrynus dorsalis]
MSGNLKSVLGNEHLVFDKLMREVDLGRMSGPFLSPPFQDFRVSPLGLVPKRVEGQFRLIHHLSYPKGESVNDGIDKEESRVQYASFDRALSLVRSAGRGCLMAKSDIKSAFRLLPIHPECYHLLGCSLLGSFFFDMCLPMGCAISCYYFEVFSSFLDWVICQSVGVHSVLHYLDDFLFIGPGDSDECSRLLHGFREIAACFGVPIAEEKTEGPQSVITFLGIEINSVDMVFRLPQDKLDALVSLVARVRASKKVTLRQLQTLMGHLVFACRVMPMGRPFCRRLSLATRGVRSPHHRIRVTKSIRDDLSVWQEFLSEFNGHTCWQQPELTSSDLELFTDASGSVGFGAYFGGRWCAARWPQALSASPLVRNLTFLEFFPIVVSVEVWGDLLRDRRIVFWTDNLSVVHVINRSTSSSLPVLALLRRLVLCCLRLNICFRARHVPGLHNSIADSLSRLQIDQFRLLAPEAAVSGVTCPEWLWSLASEFF